MIRARFLKHVRAHVVPASHPNNSSGPQLITESQVHLVTNLVAIVYSISLLVLGLLFV